MRIQVLGCSGGVGPGLRTTSLLVDDTVLIDAGSGVDDLSLDQMRRIGDIFLTHSHLDHVCGLAFMADNLFDLVDRPIRVHGSARTLEALHRHIFNWVIWPDFTELPNKTHPIMVLREMEAQVPVESIAGLRFTAFPVKHTVPAVGYGIRSDTGTFVFSGDTTATDSLWAYLNELPALDKLMIEIAFPDEDAALGLTSGHFTPSLLGRELKRLRHRPELLLTHHKPGSEASIERQCRVALEGWRYRHLMRGDVFEV